MSKYDSVFSKCIKGTGALITVNLGFRPKYVKVINLSTAGKLEWLDGMGQGTAYKDKDGTAGEAGYTSVIASNGITVYDTYITIGTDATNAAPTITTTGTGSKGSTSLTVASASNMLVGHTIYGTGIPLGAKIEAINSLVLTLSKPLTADLSGGAVGVANLAIYAE